MAMTPVISRNGWEMQVAAFPDRKKLALTITPVNGCQMFVLGYFNSDAMAKCFEEFLDGDIDAWMRECAEKSNVADKRPVPRSTRPHHQVAEIMTITTTLNHIRAHSPCRDGWTKLLRGE